MIHFSWRKFCDTYGVDYVERGPNTARGHISIPCPFCGDDPSQHLGLNLDARDPKWGCLRNAKHRGRDPTWLVRKLLRCGEELAKQVVMAQRPETDLFEDIMDKLIAGGEQPQNHSEPVANELHFPKEFKPVMDNGYGWHFLEYLEKRGFDDPAKVAHKYDLHYCLTGAFQWRLIIPFFDSDKLVGWTGRAIRQDARLRYLTLPYSTESADKLGIKELALVDPNVYVWRRDLVEKGNRGLVIVEGPMDALKLDFYNPHPDVTITAVFGKPKREQVEFLGRCARKHRSVTVVLDADASESEAWSLADEIEELSGVNAVAVPLPRSVKDPGDLSESQVMDLMHWA